MMQFSYQIGPKLETVTIEPTGDTFRVTVGDKTYAVAARPGKSGELELEVEGRRWRVQVACAGADCYVAMAGQSWRLQRLTPQQQRRPASHAADAGSLEASMPGQVLEVLVTTGEQVARGDTLLVLEAMKMELRVTAPYAGHVRQIHCTAGQVVERGQLLLEIEQK
jgi:biotin carboxyl carrier protein